MSRVFCLLAALTLAACAEPPSAELVGLTEPEVAMLSAARPAGGTCELVSRTILPPEPGQPANVRHLQLVYDCRLLHLGRTTATAEETATFTATGPVISNTTAYTAADGDQLFVAFSGSGTPPDANLVVSVSGTETVTGGTGRFAGATGSLTRTGAVSTASLSGRFEMSGTLGY